jgi:hypothetical protein
MTAPMPARSHANMSVVEREFTFDALLAEFGEVETQAPDAAAEKPAPEAVPSAASTEALLPAAAAAPQAAESAAASAVAPQRRSLLTRPLKMPSPEALKLSGLIAIAALSLTLVFIAISR